jgi:hypothetical protein
VALAKGVHPRIELRDMSGAQPYLDMGVKHFCVGWDVTVLRAWWQEQGAGMRGLLGSKPAAGKPVPPGETSGYR